MKQLTATAPNGHRITKNTSRNLTHVVLVLDKFYPNAQWSDQFWAGSLELAEKRMSAEISRWAKMHGNDSDCVEYKIVEIDQTLA